MAADTMTARRWCKHVIHNKRSLGDWLSIGLLVAIPILIWAPAAIAGRPIIVGDDLTQNFPLRVLSGELLRSGRAPLWDPFTWSGTPLLANWNAGALYPGTWLFAAMSHVAAWTVNLISVGVVSGLGMYALLRVVRCRPFPSLVGAVVFTYTGFLSGQLSHIGLEEGTGYMPWALVALELIIAGRGRSRFPAVALLAGSIALCVLAGDPRAVTSTAIALFVWLVVAEIQGRGPRGEVAVSTIVGFGLGLGISAIQLVPGVAFVHGSQRGLLSYSAFGAGSLSLGTIALFLLVPFALGANGHFGLPKYIGVSHLSEMTIGVGLLALSAAAYLACASMRTRVRGFAKREEVARRESARPLPRLVGWYALLVVGVVLALGTTTPLGHLLSHVPFYGGERLQNRNAAIIDLSLSALLALFVDYVTVRRPAATAAADATAQPRRPDFIDGIAGSLPALVAVVLVVVIEFAPRVIDPVVRLHRALPPGWTHKIETYLLLTLVTALVVLVFVVAFPRVPINGRIAAIALICLVEVGVFVANDDDYSGIATNVLSHKSTFADALTASGVPPGRYAVYNPLRVVPPVLPDAFTLIGAYDTNILQGLPSVQGYGSILDAEYARVTDTHQFGDLSTVELSTGFRELDLEAIVTLPQYLGVTKSAATTSPTWSVPARGEREWRLPAPVALSQLTLNLGDTRVSTPYVSVAAESANGRTEFAAEVGRTGIVTLALSTTEQIAAIVIRAGSSPAVVRRVEVRSRGGNEALVLNGSLQTELGPSWHYGYELGPFVVFINGAPSATAWLEAPNAPTALAPDASFGSVHALDASTAPVPTFRVAVKRPALFVWSEAFAAGWSATLAPSGGGPTRVISSVRLGLVQAVRIPPGRFVLRMTYRPRDVRVGEFISVASLLLLVVGAVASLLRRRRSRRGTG